MAGQLVMYNGRKRQAAYQIARYVSKRYKYSPKVRAAVALGQYAYKNRRAIKSAARRGGKVFKSFRKRLLPTKKQGSNAIQEPNVFGSTPITMGTLFVQPIVQPSLVTSGSELAGRTSESIFTKGFKICRQFNYTSIAGSAIDVGPIVVHWALLQYDDTRTPPSAAAISTRFFRSAQSATQRSVDFLSYNISSPWQMGMNCMAINPDEQVRVLTRRKKILYAEPHGGTQISKSTWFMNKYYTQKKLQRRITTTAANVEQPIVEVYWYNTLNDAQFPANPLGTSYINTCSMNTLYFRNTT